MFPFKTLPILAVGKYTLIPIQKDDFEALYAAASDREIWAQHPNKNRYERDVFKIFFEGALKSGGAYKIIDVHSNSVIGSTRLYDYDPINASIFIGYTFFTKPYWGKGVNPMIKRMLLDFLFKYVHIVYLHIGAENIRSQISIERLGAKKIDKITKAYFGEPERVNYVYEFRKENWR